VGGQSGPVSVKGCSWSLVEANLALFLFAVNSAWQSPVCAHRFYANHCLYPYIRVHCKGGIMCSQARCENYVVKGS
jgi:hypothetical protein